MAENYEDILSQSWDNIPKVKTLPVGSWRLKGRNASYQPAKSQEGNPSVLFVYTPVEPMDDVDDDELGKLGADYDFANNRIFYRIWIETAVEWDKVRKHLAKHGVEVEGSLKDGLEAFKGTEVISYLNHRTFTDAAGEPQVDLAPSNFSSVED